MSMVSSVVSVTAGDIALSNVQAVNRGGEGRRAGTTRIMHSVVGKTESMGRRGLFLSLMFASAEAVSPQVNDSRTSLLQKYLKKSKENKAKNDKERLDDFYKRNYKDYFEFLEGSIKAKKDELSESEKGILDWLQTNK